jgi:hypothetical protein
VAQGANESLGEVLDAIEEKFIEDMDGPGGKNRQKGNSANSRYQSRNNNKIEKLTV